MAAGLPAHGANAAATCAVLDSLDASMLLVPDGFQSSAYTRRSACVASTGGLGSAPQFVNRSGTHDPEQRIGSPSSLQTSLTTKLRDADQATSGHTNTHSPIFLDNVFSSI